MFAQALARSARLFRSGAALIHDEHQVSWAELGQQMAAIAGAMQAAGIKPGDRVAVLAGNSPAHATLIYAITWAGAVLVPLNTRLSAQEMSRIIAEAGVVALFSDAENAALAGRLVASADLISLAIDAGAVGADQFDDWAAHPGVDAALVPASDLAAIFYTGGTTGAPKGVMLSDGALLMQGMSLVDELSITRASIVHQAPPLFHCAGAGVAHACVISGATQLFTGPFDAQGLLQTVQHRRATHVSVVPTMMSVIMELDGVGEAFASVQRIVYGSSSISPAVLRKVMDACPHVDMTQIYGQTECAGPCLFLPPDSHVLSGPRAERLSCAGRPSVYSEIRLVDDHGQAVAPGTPGEITLRSPSVMLGYWNMPEATATALRGGWLHTGDVGVETEDGFIRIVDRLKDMIVTGGENVFCAEVENAITDHPDVRYCSVLGVPDEKWGERVHAVVALTADSSLDSKAIIAHCRAQIAGYKCPKTIEITDEPLPLSPVGKVRKDLLRARYLEALGD